MCTKSNSKNRIVAVKTIDRLFYEPGNAKRCHKQAYKLITHPLYGICKESNRNYRKASHAVCEQNPLPEHLEEMLHLDIELIRNMPPSEVAQVLRWLRELVEAAIERAKPEKALNAERIKKYLSDYLKR